MRNLRIAMAQPNITVGDFEGNERKILQAINEAKGLGADLISFPELAICGYPPEDLLYKPRFIQENLRVLDKVIEHSSGISVVIGFIDANEDLFNAAAVIDNGKLVGVYHKICLPNYGVFDELRYFRSGTEYPVYVINGIGIGVNICDDIWYGAGPTTTQVHSGAEVIVNLSASPYYHGKSYRRESMLSTRAIDNVAIITYTNMVGGQDQLVFEGDSMAVDEKGRLIARGKHFEEDLIVADLDVDSVFQARLQDPHWRSGSIQNAGQCSNTAKIIVSEEPNDTTKPPLPARKFVLELEGLEPEEPASLNTNAGVKIGEQPLSFGIRKLAKGNIDVRYLPGEVYKALVLGTHDYVHKNGMGKVVIGLSGGIDSSLVAAIAADALGANNVTGVTMPSRHSRQENIDDARLLANNLGISLINIPIDTIFHSYSESLADFIEGAESRITEENINSRIRGNIIMSLSNKYRWLGLTTGNKTELAIGYAALHGDRAGGFAVIKDVHKTMVYTLAKYRNWLAGTELIPTSIFDKKPSSELKPKHDGDKSIPPYYILDPILIAYIEEDKSVENIIEMGFDEAIVRQIARLVDNSEYKRRQSPPGVKISTKAFGRDRRLPITHLFRE